MVSHAGMTPVERPSSRAAASRSSARASRPWTALRTVLGSRGARLAVSHWETTPWAMPMARARSAWLAPVAARRAASSAPVITGRSSRVEAHSAAALIAAAGDPWPAIEEPSARRPRQAAPVRAPAPSRRGVMSRRASSGPPTLMRSTPSAAPGWSAWSRSSGRLWVMASQARSYSSWAAGGIGRDREALAASTAAIGSCWSCGALIGPPRARAPPRGPGRRGRGRTRRAARRGGSRPLRGYRCG